jgi:para-aminobenzoate synthetase
MSVFRVLAGVDPTLAFENPVEVLRAAAGDPDAALGPAQERLDDGAWIAGYLGYDGSIALGVFEGPREVALPYDGAAKHSPLLSRVGRAEYEAAIGDLQRSIYEGDVYQVNYTVPFAFETQGDPLALYARYARRTGAKYQAFVEDEGRAILSWSPELFLAFDGARVETKPMKGTAALDRIEELGSDKNRAEHLMIVDLLRNDLGRVSEIDSVRVPDLMVVEPYATVHQVVSTITGQLEAGRSSVECVRNCFPGGSMTGAPKERTMEIIDELEDQARGVYSGAIGYFGVDGAVDLSIVIRTIVIRPGRTTIGAGGAIVMQSDPEEEFDEILLKARAPMAAIARTVTGRADESAWSVELEPQAASAEAA